MKKTKREKELETALEEIASLGHGMKEDMKDHANIGRMAIAKAQKALAGACPGCGRDFPFRGPIRREGKAKT